MTLTSPARPSGATTTTAGSPVPRLATHDVDGALVTGAGDHEVERADLLAAMTVLEAVQLEPVVVA
ncbi:hypothetical protein ACWFNE_15580 [Cellulomonas sp. NPDC055163]